MTLEDALIDSLVWRGLFPDEAREVFAAFRADLDAELPGIPWNTSAGEMRIHGLKTFEASLRARALAWLDQHRPDRHARKNFVAK